MTTAEMAETHEVPAEDVPTGTFGRVLYPLPRHTTPCTPTEQAAHLQELVEALCGFAVGDAMRRHAQRTPGPHPQQGAA